MTFLTWTNIGGYVAVAAVTFFLIVRLYSRRLRAGLLGRDWYGPGVFSFGLLMGVIWPLTILWLAAVRPSRAERKEVARRDLARTAIATERKAQALGVGGWDDEEGGSQ